jgi:hypothetical protein
MQTVRKIVGTQVFVRMRQQVDHHTARRRDPVSFDAQRMKRA